MTIINYLQAAAVAVGRTLLVARESSIGAAAKVLLEHLFTRIIGDLEGTGIEIPELDNAMDMYDNPVGPNVKVFQVTRPHTRAVLIRGKNTDVLLSLGSARKTNQAGDNAFVDILVEVLKEGAYDRVVTTSIERLCRNETVAGKLLATLQEYGTELWLSRDWRLDPNRATDTLLFSFLMWFATFEAEMIEARTRAGQMAHAAAGGWPYGYAPPPGWCLADDGSLQADPETAEAVRWYIAQVLAGETNWSELSRQTLRRWPDLRLRRGDGALADGASPAGSLQTSWLNPAWYGAYSDFVYEVVFVPHAVHVLMESDNEVKQNRGRSLLEGLGTMRVELPPLDEPILDAAHIPLLESRLKEAKSSRSPQRPPGSVFGAASIFDADGVEDARTSGEETG